LKRKSL